MTNGGGGENADLVGTTISLIKSNEVLEIKDRIFEIGKRGIRAVFSYTISEDDEPKTIYNRDILEHPEQEIKIVQRGSNVEPLQEVEIDGVSVVELNLDAFSGEGKQEILDDVISTEQEQTRFLTHEQEQEFEVAERARRDEDINEVIDYFSDYLSSSQLKLLRRSLSIRIAWEDDNKYTSPQTVRKWKNDLKNRFGEAGNIVPNFCSSGYYDEGGILRHIMEDLGEVFDNPKKIQAEYENIVEDHPFVVYVGKFDGPEGIKEDALSRIQEYDSHPFEVPYVDIRAQGYRNKETAERAISRVENQFKTLPINIIEGEREIVYRIDPENAVPR